MTTTAVQDAQWRLREVLFDKIVAEPSSVVRTFKLVKVFHALLPQDAKTLSANEIADIIRTKLVDAKAEIGV